MSIFHSTVSRREFMKFMGVGAATASGAALAAPVFHDMDELMSAPAGIQKRPWYVKERDFENPSMEIDWSLLKRADCRLNGQSEHGCAIYYGADRVEGAFQTALNSVKGLTNKTGYSYQNRALKMASTTAWPAYVAKDWTGYTVNPNWKGPAYAPTLSPSERGEPPWTGTPEEGARILSAYMRYRGSGLCGFGELAGRTKNQVISNNHKGPIIGYTRPATSLADNVPMPSATCKQIVFEDVDQGYEGPTKYVVPNKSMYYISNLGPGNVDRGREGPSCQQQGETEDTSQPTLRVSVYNFLHFMGYQFLGAGGDDGTPFIEGAAAALTGVGEMSRQNNYMLTPEYGPIGRLHNFLTDLPIAPSKPIDAGMFRFCHSCHKCANACPVDAISQDSEPSWDLPPIEGKPNLTHNPGTKAFWANGASCCMYWREIGFLNPALYSKATGNAPELNAGLATGCFRCFGNCTFTQDTGAMVHQVVKGTIANVSVFNGFFFHMAESFGYGVDLSNQAAEDWWDKSYPIFGIDTTRVAFDGGYKKP